MANITLTLFENPDGIELVIDTRTGEAFVTLCGYCLMTDTPRDRVLMRLKEVQKKFVKTTRIITPWGFGSFQLISAKLIGKWLANDKPELVEAMLEAGVTSYLQKIAGYEKSVKLPKSDEPETIKFLNEEPLPQFFFENLLITNDDHNRLSCKEMYSLYTSFIIESGDYNMSRTRFIKRIQPILRRHKWLGTKKAMRIDGMVTEGFTGVVIK